MVTWTSGIVLLAAVVTLMVAVAGLWQSPRLRASQMFALGMLAVAAMQIANLFVVVSDQPTDQLHWFRLAILFEGLGPVCWLAFSLFYARAHPSKLSTSAWLAIAFVALMPLTIALIAWDRLLILPMESSMIGRYLLIGSWGRLYTTLILIGSVAPLVNLEATLRASAAVGRWQIKFMIVGIGLLIGFEIYSLSYRLLFSFIDLWMIGPRAIIAIVASGLMVVSLLRARQGTLELGISHTALYRSFTLLLIGGYLIAVGGLARLWSMIGGSTATLWQGMLVLVALASLAALLLSSRFNARVKLALARHVYSNRFDYRQEWLRLTENMSKQFGVDASLRVAVERLSEALSASHVSAWLFDESGQRLYLASTVQLPSEEEAAWRTQPLAAPALAAALLSWDGPKIIEPSPSETTDSIPSELHTLAHSTRARMVAPLVAGRRALGLLAIGPSATGRRYGNEEVLLTGAIAQQSAACVMTAHLTHELLRAREVELSQLYSTFLIHDLKNLGTTLSLVAQNLPRCYADPNFRDDAIRVIRDTTGKISAMTQKVATLSQHYEPVLEPTDMNQIVHESLNTLNGSCPSTITHEQEPLPLVMADRRQMRSVLTNLLLNAQDAIGNTGGAIRLRTQHLNGRAIVSVIDEGCGMSEEFIQEHLFQPFHSTKPNGLGIGLFQCRKIIDAHGGRLDIQSQAGKGTIVILSLPSRQG